MFARPRAKAQQAGQAILEYILVLVVIVSIVLGIMYQFNDAFRSFLDNYFGDYIACLLETGELPSLGGDGPTSSECISPFANFNLAAGADGGGSSGSGSGSGSGSNSGSGSDSSDGSGSDDASGSGRGSGSSSRAGSSSRPSSVRSSGGTGNAEGVRGRNSRGRVTTIKKTIGGGNSIKGKNVGFGNDSSGGASIGRRSRTIRRKRVIYLGESYLTEDAKKKKKNPVLAKGKNNKKKGAVGNLRQPKFTLKLPEDRAIASSEDNSGFSFGALIKFMLIMGILIALFIFLGGQAVQIKKSWQKSD